MTPNEITTLIASNFDKELDIPFRLQLMERVKYWRSRLIANALQKNPAQRKFFKQPVYLKMHTAFAQECIAGIGSKQSISDENVPLLIRAGNTLFDYVGGIDGRSPFREAVSGTQNYLSTGKFSAMFPAYQYSTKMYVDEPGIPIILIEGIFDDPLAVMEMNCKCSESPTAGDCDTWNKQFPCSGDIMQLIVQSILQVDYNMKDNKPTTEVPVDKP